MYCASCCQDYSEDTVMHYVNKHYYNPLVNVRAEETKPTMDFDFWYHECVTHTVCPSCRQQTDVLISATEKHVRFDCLNRECKAVLFYRKIELKRTV